MSNIVTLLLLAGALGSDATSMAVGVGISGVSKKQISITSLAIAFFHVVMPLLGLYLGRLFGKIAGDLASWIGAGILILLGLNMLREAYLNTKEEKPTDNPKTLKGWRIILLSLGVSLDAFSVGFSLGTFSQLSVPVIVVTIGIVAGLMSAAGFILGKRLGRLIGDRALSLGGFILIFLGLKIMV